MSGSTVYIGQDVAAARLAKISRHLSVAASQGLPSSSNSKTSSESKMPAAKTHTKKHKVAIIGSGNWGSAIAKILAENTAAHPDVFERDVPMWVFEEDFKLPTSHKLYNSSVHSKPQKLTSIINSLHENVKYLPDIPLPHNVIANPSLLDTVKDASLLVFNVPHQFVSKITEQLKGHVSPTVRAISCIKGVDVSADGISLFSEVIGRKLGIYCGALSGANIANEVAQEKFSETTIAYDPPSSLEPVPSELPTVDAHLWKLLFHRPYFHVRVIKDVAGVSLGGALKNVVALAAGFVDGKGWGDNAKAAIMRVGIMEMRKFGTMFFKDCCSATFTEESAGVADLITSCAGGRNHKCAKLSIERNMSVEQVEQEVLNGQKLQGTSTSKEVNEFLKRRNLEDEFPLFTAVYRILQGEAKVDDIPEILSQSAEQ